MGLILKCIEMRLKMRHCKRSQWCKSRPFVVRGRGERVSDTDAFLHQFLSPPQCSMNTYLEILYQVVHDSETFWIVAILHVD